MGVKNGSLGTVEGIESGVLKIKLDGAAETRVIVDTKFYQHLDYGYASTVHKAQGTTVDRSYVLATPHFDRHTTYVALSRHREAATVFYASDDFGGHRPDAIVDEVRSRFTDTLSRARPKELAHDYLERETAPDSALASSLVVHQWERTRSNDATAPGKHAPSPMNEIDFRQQRAAERWAARQQNGPTLGQGTDRSPTHNRTREPARPIEPKPELRRDGPEDDFLP